MNLLAIILQEGAKGPGLMNNLIMFGAIGIVFYFFMLRPQLKRTKEAKNFRENLAQGDKVVTAGGIHGKVLEINENTIVISTEGGGKLRVEKNSITANPGDMIANQRK
ncbi:MAG: preprotein translocase subunit YajC [Crocinitomicaceae bacterium]|nr:preprotein translocase subunit YajC [Crocinitomicaceae bacterium]